MFAGVASPKSMFAPSTSLPSASTTLIEAVSNEGSSAKYQLTSLPYTSVADVSIEMLTFVVSPPPVVVTLLALLEPGTGT